MNTSIRLCLLLLTVLTASLRVPAQSPAFGFGRAGAFPSAASGQPVALDDRHSIRLPAGWSAERTDEGVLVLPPGATFDPARDDNPEVYLLSARDDYDPAGEAEVARNLGAAMTRGGGSGGTRQPMTFGSRRGAAYRWSVPHQRTGRILAFDVYVAALDSHAVVAIAIGDAARVRAHDATLRQVLATTTAATPAATLSGGGSLADDTALAQRWLAKLRGKTVRQFWASQGMSSEKTHWLNADGTYRFKSDSMVSISVPGASALTTDGDKQTGRWRIRDTGGRLFLEVTARNGSVRQLRITEDDRNWYLNGEKAFVE